MVGATCVDAVESGETAGYGWNSYRGRVFGLCDFVSVSVWVALSEDEGGRGGYVAFRRARERRRWMKKK